MTFKSLVLGIVGFGNFYVIPLIISIAFLAFLWGVFQYFILGAADAEKQIAGRTFLLWSLLALGVIFSAWGLVNMVLTTFGLR